MRDPSHLHPSHLWTLLRLSDPDLGRLRKGLWATLSAGLAALLTSQLARLLGEPATVTLVGTLVAMMASQLATDSQLREQRLSTVLMALPATVAILIGTLVAGNALLGGAAFALTIFLATAARRFGPRGTALGMIGFFAFFNALFFHARPAQLPALVGAVWLGVGIAFGVRFLLLPDRPQRDFGRILRSFHQSIDVLLGQLADLSVRPQWGSAVPRQLARQVDALNDTALSLEQLLGPEGNGLRLRLFDLELAANRVLRAVQLAVESGALAPAVREELRRALLAARAPVRCTRPGQEHSVHAHLERVRALCEDPTVVEQGRADARRFHTSLTDLVEAAARLHAEPLPVLAPRAEEPPPPEPEKLPGLHPTTRQALQATVASLIAMVAGHALSPERWHWAAITAFVIFTRTATRGETLLRAWGRVLGTVLGVVAGLLLAQVIHGHASLELGVIFACVFLGFYLLPISYGWMVFWFTTLISVLYGLLGSLTPQILYLRVEETAIGAGAGVLTALLLFPERTRVHVHASARKVLGAVQAYLEEAVVNRSPDTDPTRLLMLARVLDLRLRDLRTAARPLNGRLLRFAPRTARTVHSVSELVLFVRHLAMGRGMLYMNGSALELTREAGLRLVHNARALALALEQDGPPALEPAAALLEKAQNSLSGEETVRRGPASPPIFLHWLTRVDDTLSLLAKCAAFQGRGSAPA